MQGAPLDRDPRPDSNTTSRAYAPRAKEIARAAGSLMVHLSGETDPILWEWCFVETGNELPALGTEPSLDRG